MEADRLRTIVASLVFRGDFQELMHLYAAADISLSPEDVARVYPLGSLLAEERRTLDEVRAAIPDDLLPRLDAPCPTPAEMVELAGRFAAERGEHVLATKAFREVDALDRYQQLYGDFAMESLASGSYEQAAFELVLAGRLGWNRLASEQRLALVTGLGIDENELAYALGAQRLKGKLSGGRALPEFPAFQTYGPLLHALCRAGGCVARRSLSEVTPLAIRYLIHDGALTERALAAVGDQAPRLLAALAAETDPDLSEYAAAHAEARERFRRLQTELDEADEEEPEAPPAEAAPEESGEEEEEAPPEEEAKEESASRSAESTRQGLEAVQALLLGRPERSWRNCLAELAARHPLSVFTVCTVRAGSLGSFVIPVEENGTAFLQGVTTGR